MQFADVADNRFLLQLQRSVIEEFRYPVKKLKTRFTIQEKFIQKKYSKYTQPVHSEMHYVLRRALSKMQTQFAAQPTIVLDLIYRNSTKVHV